MSVNKVEALKKVYYNLSEQTSKGNTVAEVLQDIYAALSEETTKQSNVTHLIDMISEYAEGGGGGGGDFSTASVAISNTVEFSNDFDCPYIEDANGDIPAHVASTKYLESGATATIDVVTYNGVAVGTIGDTNNTYTVSGDITTEQGEYEVLFLITGDGSITISEA